MVITTDALQELEELVTGYGDEYENTLELLRSLAWRPRLELRAPQASMLEQIKELGCGWTFQHMLRMVYMSAVLTLPVCTPLLSQMRKFRVAS